MKWPLSYLGRPSRIYKAVLQLVKKAILGSRCLYIITCPLGHNKEILGLLHVCPSSSLQCLTPRYKHPPKVQ